MEAFAPVGLLLAIALAMCAGILGLTTWLGPRRPSAAKLSTYECGAIPEGNARQPFRSRFYLIAVLFLLFDVEAVFFIPWALVYRESLAEGAGLLLAMLVYLGFVVLGLIYVIRKKCLELY